MQVVCLIVIAIDETLLRTNIKNLLKEMEERYQKMKNQKHLLKTPPLLPLLLRAARILNLFDYLIEKLLYNGVVTVKFNLFYSLQTLQSPSSLQNQDQHPLRRQRYLLSRRVVFQHPLLLEFHPLHHYQ